MFGIVPRVDRFFYGSRYGKRNLPIGNDHADSYNNSIDGKYMMLKKLEALIKYYDKMKEPVTNNYENLDAFKYNNVNYSMQ